MNDEIMSAIIDKSKEQYAEIKQKEREADSIVNIRQAIKEVVDFDMLYVRLDIATPHLSSFSWEDEHHYVWTYQYEEAKVRRNGSDSSFKVAPPTVKLLIGALEASVKTISTAKVGKPKYVNISYFDLRLVEGMPQVWLRDTYTNAIRDVYDELDAPMQKEARDIFTFFKSWD